GDGWNFICLSPRAGASGLVAWVARRTCRPDEILAMAGIDKVDVALSLLKIVIVVGALLNVTPIMVWVERRGSALIQDRPGPNRVGPFGLFQSLADAAKFFLKEDIVP